MRKIDRKKPHRPIFSTRQISLSTLGNLLLTEMRYWWSMYLHSTNSPHDTVANCIYTMH